tara:strand:+ start:25758 stop:25931 length:174 start_codon:yes stop_codon:yes gene_type:complete
MGLLGTLVLRQPQNKQLYHDIKWMASEVRDYSDNYRISYIDLEELVDTLTAIYAMGD